MSHKRSKRKKESRRKGALLPDVIRINNHIKYTRMSKKEHEARCKDLSKLCDKETLCNEHISLNNLRGLSRKLRNLISKSSGILADWKRFKKVHSRSFGYLSSAINNPEIKRELEAINELVDRFNKIKENLEEYKEEIANWQPTISNPLRKQAPGRTESRRFWRFTHKKT